MTSIDIVELIEANPITKFSGDYQSRMVEKLRESFTESHQQWFLSSFYCYLNCSKTEFVVDLDDVWEWMGFHDKATAKRCLVKHFVAEKDYANLLGTKAKQTYSHGGHNKQVIKLTVPAFKRFCLKAGTSKADEIHEYLGDMLSPTTPGYTNHGMPLYAMVRRYSEAPLPQYQLIGDMLSPTTPGYTNHRVL
jgi:hypothetical protein